jgi:putative signal transducing protein
MNLDKSRLVTVLTTGNEAVIAVAKSLLDDADIKYFAKGEQLQNLFGVGTIGTGYNPLVGPIQLQVEEHQADEAKTILAGLEE